jgi:hypothetical protein
MRLSKWFLFALLSTLLSLSGTAFAAGGLVINGGAGNVNIAGMLAVSNPTSPGLSVTSRTSGAVNLNGATTLNTGAQHAVSLSTNNTGHTTNFAGTLDIDTTSGTGFFANSGGTFVATGAGNSINATSGPAIDLTSTAIGASGAALGAVNSTNSPSRGIHLNAVAGVGSLTTTGGAITGAVGIPVEVSGGTVSMTYAGGITQGANNPMVQVTGGHNTGTITFQTGTLNAMMGTGLQFNNADATYNFNGTTTLMGGDAGVDITGGSGGTFNFGTGTTITNPIGTAFNINGSNCGGTYSGSISDNSGFAIDVDNHDAGTYTFQTGTLTSTGTGVRVANSNGGTIDFAFPTKTLNTAANTAVTLNTNNGGGTVNFTGGGLDIDTTTATAFSATGGGTVNVTGANNTIDTTSGRPVDIQNTNAGGSGITFARALSSGGGQVANIVTSTGTKTLGRVSTSSGATTALNLNGAGTVNIGDAALASSLTTTTAPAITINNSTLGFSGLGVGLNTTGGGAGVSVTGGTVAISGNGMVIDTDDATDGPGFVATSGGTVTVQGTGHTVTSGNQTAVNIANTTIGANDVTFRSVATNGASSGIILNNTGSSGGLHVTGTGSAGSGGTVQNSSGDGISLTNTQHVSLAHMTVTNADEDGIDGTSVNNFTLANSSVTNNGDAANEEGISFSNLSGTVSFTNVMATGNAYNNLRIDNTAGTISSFSISGGSYSNNQPGIGNHGILIEPRGTSQITTATVNGAVISGNEVMGIQVATADTATVSAFTVSGNTIQNNELGVDFSKAQTSNLTFNISNNLAMTGQNSHGINLFTAVGAGTTGNFRGRIENNTIGNAAVDGSGSAIGNGIRVNINGDANADILLHNNVIRECPNGRGIEVIGRNGTGGLDVTVTNNDVDHVNLAFNPGTSDFPLAAIMVQSNCVTVCNTVRSDIRGNTVPAGSSFDFTTGYITLTESSTSVLELVDNPPASANAAAELSSQNTGSTGTVGTISLIAGPISTPP